MEDSKTSLVVASSNEHTCWETCVDDEGNTYYFDPISGESTWDRPEQQDKNGRWIECRDDQDRTYYYDTQTQETTWNIPLEHRPYAKSVDLESKRRNRKVTGLIESDSSEKDIWMSKEELRAKSNDYILTTSDRLDLEKQQRAKKRKEIRAQIKEERKEINRKIFKTWEPHIKEALVTGALNCSWKGFRVVHPKVYEMKQLTALRLVGNALNDVPRKIGICLPNLRVLSLSCNGMRLLPSSIGRLVNLVELNLQKNCLATLPDEICNLVNLVDLDLTNNRLKELPKNFGNLRKIPRLSLERNRLTTLPDSFQDTKPSTLILTANSFCQFPSSVFNLVCLRRVSINQNSLETLPDAISKMVNLEYLSACNNLLTDLPHGITTLQNLKSLWLDWNSIEELPEGFRFLETLSDLKMEGNPMRFPMIEIIQRGGATAALKWCQNRHKRNVRMSKRAVVEALQKTFQLIRQHNIADASLFEPETEYDNGLGVMEEYYAFQIEALYMQWLPAIDALEPEKRNFRKATWFFPYTKEQLVVAMREYVDSSGTSVGLFRREVCFRKCCCVDKFGERLVCIPPRPGFLCQREASLVKMSLATKSSDQLRRMKIQEGVKVKHARAKARRHAQEYVSKPETQIEMKNRAAELAESTMEERLKADFVKKHAKKIRKKREAERKRRNEKRVKLKRKRRERISKLEREKESLMSLLETANEFEVEVMEEDIEKLNAEIKEPAEDLEMKNLDVEEEISEKEYARKIADVAEAYKPRGKMRKRFDRMKHSYQSLAYDLKCKLEEDYITGKEKEEENQIRHQFKVMKIIIGRWSKLHAISTFETWKNWTRRRIDARERLRKLRVEREELRESSLAAADALRDAEYAKWEKMTDPYTGNEYYKHKETGEEVFEIPIRDYSDN